MEYQKIIYLLENEVTQSCKFKTKNCVEINDDKCGMYNINIQIKFKTTMLDSGLWDYSDVYIHVKGKIKFPGAVADAAEKQADKRNKQVIFKNCTPFADYISETNNTQCQYIF